jgi:mannose/fructose/N-acetylgalactosamine-specific phosphotransferase system component IID
LLEASWNDDGKQNIGRAAVMQPILNDLYPDYTGRLKDYLRPFNTNPINSGLVLGAAIRMEERRANGDDITKKEESLLDSLASVASAQGDQLFWNTWLPFCSLLAFSVSFFSGSLWAPFLLPILFSTLTIACRFSSFFLGYSRTNNACNINPIFVALTLRRWLHSAIIFSAGIVTVLVLDRAAGAAEVHFGLAVVFAATVFLILVATKKLRKRWPQLLLLLYLLDVVCFYLIFMFWL